MTEYGELIAPGTLRFRRELAAPVDRVWAHLTEPEERARWLAGGATDPRPGGKAEFVFDNAALSAPGDGPPPKYAQYTGVSSFTGEVVAAEPPHRLVVLWPQEDGVMTEVAITLEDRGERTLLTLTQKDIGDRDTLLGAAAGWHTHLAILAAKLAGDEAPSFWSTHTALEGEYGERLD